MQRTQRQARAEFITSIAGTIVFAHYYALIERMMDWRKVWILFFYFPDWRGLNGYHYVFMASLFLFVGGLPLLDDFFLKLKDERFIKEGLVLVFGNMLCAALVEDAAYWYLFGEWVYPTCWTCQILGYLDVFGYPIPTWYFIFAMMIAACYYYAFCGIKTSLI